MLTPRRWFVFLGAVVHVLGAASYSLDISPERMRINKEVNTTVTIQCSADVPLTACQMSWWAEKESPGPVLDLGPGPRAKVDADGVLGYSYAGRGLGAGDCGVTLTLLGKKVWTVGCRVQGGAGQGWRYKTMDLVAYSTDPLPGVAVDRPSTVVLPGREATVMCAAPGPVDACYLSLPGRHGYLDFYAGLASSDSGGRHVYRGAGRASGQCGLTWRDVTEADNGPVRCYLWRAPRYAENRGVVVVVARAPEHPVLHVVHDGTTLRATCTVDGGRPAPDVQWRLGDDVIRNDDLDDVAASPDDAWTWPWSVTRVGQTLTRTLEPGDYGKVLKCVTSHVALEEPLEARETLTKSGDEGPSGSGPSVTGHPSSPSYKPRPCPALVAAICAVERGGGDACPADDEVRQLRVTEAKAAVAAAELALQAARSAARAEDARARSEEARAREEEAWAVNAAEELDYERERRRLGRQQTPGSCRECVGSTTRLDSPAARVSRSPTQD